MLFDFDLFSAIAAKAYQKAYNPVYSLDEVLSVFRYYFGQYEKNCKQPHPHIRSEQITRIIEAMPSVECEHNGHTRDIEPEAYETIIDQHFKTKYNVGYGGCDYNINHFFTGSIRMNRYYETLY